MVLFHTFLHFGRASTVNRVLSQGTTVSCGSTEHYCSLSLCCVFSTVQLLLQQTPSDTGDMSWLIWKPPHIYWIRTPTQQKQFSGYKGKCHIICTKVTSVLHDISTADCWTALFQIRREQEFKAIYWYCVHHLVCTCLHPVQHLMTLLCQSGCPSESMSGLESCWMDSLESWRLKSLWKYVLPHQLTFIADSSKDELLQSLCAQVFTIVLYKLRTAI